MHHVTVEVPQLVDVTYVHKHGLINFNSNANQRQRLGSPTSGPRQSELDRMIWGELRGPIIRAGEVIPSASKGRRHDRSRDVQQLQSGS